MVLRDDIALPQPVVQAIDDYFLQEVHGKEFHPICLLGCGQAGTELAGIFRLKPDYVPAYLPQYFPVRAFAMDTQANLSDNLKQRIGWYEPQSQMHMEPPPENRIETLLEQAANLQQSDNEWEDAEPYEVTGATRTGGAGGFSMRGRATAMYHFGSDNDIRQGNTNILERARLLSRRNSGYLLTLSGLAGGTGSGSMPLVASFIQERLQPAPAGTFSICIVPERLNGMSNLDDLNRREPRALSNLLTALYYMVMTPAINGIILSDNIQLERQGHKDYLRIDRYLQDVLMPVFLAAQSRYIFRTQLDPANVVLTMAPRGEGKQEFIAACFAICPLNEPDERILSMEQQTVVADPSTQVPDLAAMLEKALANPTIQCETATAHSVLAVLSGPPTTLERMVPDLDAGFKFERTIEQRCIGEHPTDSPVGGGFARFFMASFPNMTDVRLTVLLSAPRVPELEETLRTALDNRNWGPTMGRETLADALRRVDEPRVRRIGLAHVQSS